MKKYTNYKNSGIEWIGEIPEHWDFYNLKFILREGIKDGPHETPIWYEDGIPFLSIDGIVDGEISFNNCRYIDEEQYQKFSKKLVIEKDDIFIGKAASIGKIARVKTDRKFTVWSPIAVIKVKNEFSPTFVEYYFRSDIIQHQIELFSTSNTQKNIAMGDIPKMKFIAPSFEEQTKIANYLDLKTTQIDHLITQKEQLIQLLQEERVAVINQAVTKGLDPTVPMKNSGIEWLGEIPEGWEVKKLKFFAEVVLGKMLTNEDKGDYQLKKYLRAKNIEWDKPNTDDVKEMWFSINEMKNFRVKKNDLLVSEGGEVGRTCIWNDELEECYIQNSVHKVTILDNGDSNYFLNQFILFGKMGHFDAIVNRISIAHLTKEKLKDISFFYPPKNEQKEISNYIMVKTNEIETIISKTQQEIELLKEYKTALISEVVTGKVDVRDVVLN